MIDRKQERTRRVRGCEMMRDLMKSQGRSALTSPTHIK